MLMKAHASSLSFLAPKELVVPRRWLLDRGSALGSIVKQRLANVVDDEFFEMILPSELTEADELLESPQTVEKIAA